MACLLGVPSGCQAPPARLAGCKAGCLVPRRKPTLARQVVADTAVAAATHPVRGARNLAVEAGSDLRAAAAGFYFKRLALPLGPPPPPLCPCRPTLNPAALEEELAQLTGSPLRSAGVRLFVDGSDALAALHQVIDQAQCRIDVLMYLWDSDPLGEAVARHLAARAGPGRRVRVLVDGGGNLVDGEPKRATVAELNRVVCWLARQPYVEVIRTRNSMARFDHRKLVLIDGRLAWSGGRNFTVPSFFEYHDLTYTLQGPLAGEMACVFEDFWRRQGGVPGVPLPLPPAPAGANASARLVRTDTAQHQLAHVLYRAVDQAQHHVYLSNAYLSDARLLLKLVRARQRGADVRAVLSLRSGSDGVDHSNKVTANRLLRAGVRVYLYPGLNHTKALAVDGCWAYFGTGNFDALSLRHNRELGLAVGAGPLIPEVERRVFLPDFRPEWELTGPMPLGPLDYFYDAVGTLFF